MNAVVQLRDAVQAQTVADVAIVGGGAAGCVLASRLSEDPKLKVILVEAGRDTPLHSTPDDVTDIFPRSYANPQYFWPLQATTRDGEDPVFFPQARIMGGGSSVMGMWAPRGVPADYDGWSRYGVDGWSHDDLLPFFKKLERDGDFTDGVHGDSGPIPIIRRHRSTWPRFTEALGQAAEKHGYEFHPDLNGTDKDGLFELPFSNDGKARKSSAHAYLDDSVRRRSNLQIVPDTEVERLKMIGRKVVGIEVRAADGRRRTINAARVIVSAGAIYSPTLLLRSGIGPAEDLARLGIEPIVDSPQVGHNLQNHPYVHLGAVVKADARHDPAMRSYVLGCVRLSSGLLGAPPSDLFMGLISRSGPRDRDIGLGMIAVSLYSPFSRGRVTLANKQGAPSVHLGLLEDERDRARLVRGARIARDFMNDASVKSMVHETFLLPPKLPMKLLNEPGFKSELFSMALAAVLDVNGTLRRFALKRKMGPERLLSALTDDETFDAMVLSSATSMAHPAGTCALGQVVDSSTAVIGAEGLFVADSSIMPKVPRANTNIPTVMVAEKAAFEIKQKLRA
jgi:5-(hydroxymethyl)furfural/furfural oxidase